MHFENSLIDFYLATKLWPVCLSSNYVIILYTACAMFNLLKKYKNVLEGQPSFVFSCQFIFFFLLTAFCLFIPKSQLEPHPNQDMAVSESV